MTATIEPAVPAVEANSFKDRLHLRIRELAADLALEPEPEVHWPTEPDADPLRIGDHCVQVPLLPSGPPAPSVRGHAEMAAESYAAAVIRHRWALIEPALAALGLPARPALRDLAELGLRVHELAALHATAPTDDVALAFAAGERHPPSVELLLHRGDLATSADHGFLRRAAESAAADYGIPVPLPEIKADAGLDRGRFRLRVGNVRNAVPSERWTGEKEAEAALRRELLRHSQMLFDVGALLSLLLDPARVPADAARAALDRADPAQLAGAVRTVLAEGIGLGDPSLLCEALAAPVAPLTFADPSDLAVSLPGVLVVADEPPDFQQPERVRQLRARLAPVYLMRRAATEAGYGGAIGVWSLGPRALSYLSKSVTSPDWLKRFAQRALEVVPERDVLVAPADQRYRLRMLLTDLLPNLTIVGVNEVPRSLRHRGSVDMGDQE
jgi:hypothetical protein